MATYHLNNSGEPEDVKDLQDGEQDHIDEPEWEETHDVVHSNEHRLQGPQRIIVQSTHTKRNSKDSKQPISKALFLYIR